MRTNSAGYDGEVFKGMPTPAQYMLSMIARDVLEFDRSKVDPVRKLVSKLRGPLDGDINPNQTEVAT